MIEHIIGRRHFWKLPKCRPLEPHLDPPDHHLFGEDDPHLFCPAPPQVKEPFLVGRVITDFIGFVVDHG